MSLLVSEILKDFTEEEVLPEPEEKFYIPTREEIDAELEKQRAKEREEEEKAREEERQALQNGTHGSKCKYCLKFTRTTPNPKSNYGRCIYHGAMVLQWQTSCGEFKLNEKSLEDDPWN